jgi:hypothetical protein
MSHIYEDPVEREVDLIARILSVCVNIQKQARYICARRQRTLCVTSSITMMSQSASSTVLLNYSEILPLKFTTIDVFYKYTKNNTKKLEMFFRLVFFTYLKLTALRNPCSIYEDLEFTSHRKV